MNVYECHRQGRNHKWHKAYFGPMYLTYCKVCGKVKR